MYPWDYSTSEYGIWQRWNPTKLQIDFFACIPFFFLQFSFPFVYDIDLGLVWDRKRALDTWNAAKLRMQNNNIGVAEYLESAKKVLVNQQAELGNFCYLCYFFLFSPLFLFWLPRRVNIDFPLLILVIFVANILESAKLCFETQQAELRTILGNATKNLEIDSMMDTACKTVELQQGISLRSEKKITIRIKLE